MPHHPQFVALVAAAMSDLGIVSIGDVKRIFNELRKLEEYAATYKVWLRHQGDACWRRLTVSRIKAILEKVKNEKDIRNRMG